MYSKHIIIYIHIQSLLCIQTENTVFLVFCRGKTTRACTLVDEECLSSVSTVCELGTNYPQPFMSPLSFKTTLILTVDSLL